jgi:two-component system NtrC family response regulator
LTLKNILIIDDEEQLRKLLSRIIALEGFSVTEASTIKAATIQLQQQQPEVILCDVRLPDGNGVDFVATVKKAYPGTEIILLTAFGNIPDGVNAMKKGAFDYLVKGNDNDRIIPLLHQAVEQALLNRKNAVKLELTDKYRFETIIGQSKSIQTAINLAKRIAPGDSTVLLLGETGSGKEVFANAIHQSSKRKDQPFIALNCSAFARDLLEGELFGHKAGAFTGATKDKKGLIEMANGGTLFLDEIGELHIDLQAKLLRVLENGQFIKLGDTKVSLADVRIIAATNRDLQTEAGQGRFREDLYYRLNVFSIPLPALRERTEDIPALVEVFLQQLAKKNQAPAPTVSAEAMSLLKKYSWKGNIRELKNVLERAFVLQDDQLILPEHLPFEIQQHSVASTAGLSLANVEQQHIRKILQATQWNKTRAAKLLEIGLATLYRKMEEYQISPDLSK